MDPYWICAVGTVVAALVLATAFAACCIGYVVIGWLVCAGTLRFWPTPAKMDVDVYAGFIILFWPVAIAVDVFCVFLAGAMLLGSYAVPKRLRKAVRA